MFLFYSLGKTNYVFAITKHNIRDECPKYLRNRFIYIMHMNRCINASRNTNTMRQNQETYWISKRETPVQMIFLVRCNNACKLQCTLHRVNTIHWYFFRGAPSQKTSMMMPCHTRGRRPYYCGTMWSLLPFDDPWTSVSDFDDALGSSILWAPIHATHFLGMSPLPLWTNAPAMQME